MIKKIISLLSVFVIAFTLSSCNKEVEVVTLPDEIWGGTYVSRNSNTGEFKILNVISESDTEVSITFKSLRSDNEFTAPFKSKSGKYAVLNAGDRCLKFNLKSENTVIQVDDIWTNSEVERNENWSGKYVILEEGKKPGEFGDPSWNGEYVCEESGLPLNVCAVSTNIVSLSYNVIAEDEERTMYVKCVLYGSDKKNAVYSNRIRRVKIKRNKKENTIEITDENPDFEALNISGKYVLKQGEENE